MLLPGEGIATCLKYSIGTTPIMHEELTEIKRRRQRLDWTQTQLANKSGLSQSFIAKLESGKIDPTFSRVRILQEVLTDAEGTIQTTAGKLMAHKLYSITPQSLGSAAAKMLSSHNISQLPVMQDQQVLGLITESLLVGIISSGKNLGKLKVREIMDDPPPIFSKKTPQKLIQEVLKGESLVLISDKGKITGVTTKADILKHVKL